MSKDPNQRQGQYPPSSWEQRGAYSQDGAGYGGPAPQQIYHQTSPSVPPSTDMATLPPPQSQQHQDLYRPSVQYDMYSQHPPPSQYPQHPHDPRDSQPTHLSFSQPAPRQRTAIACRYCRRRKIRCHGFDSSPDGRCTNCIRFHQECIFTPVSSQAHAFVPAQIAYPHLRNTGQMQQQPGGRPMYTPEGQPVLYGAHGQPLGPPLGPMPSQGQDSNYPPHGYMQAPYQGPVYDDRGPPQSHPHEQVSRKRPRLDEPSHPVISPPPQGSSSSPYPQQQRLSTANGGRRGSGSANSQFEYPDPTGLAPVSPASSTTSYQSAQYPQAPQQPYYPPQSSVRRTSPQSAYSYEARASGSPHGSTSSTSGYAFTVGGLHPPQVLPPTRESGLTPPPREGNGNGSGSGGGNGSRAGMSVRDMLGPEGGRSSADSDMLKALNRRGM